MRRQQPLGCALVNDSYTTVVRAVYFIPYTNSTYFEKKNDSSSFFFGVGPCGQRATLLSGASQIIMVVRTVWGIGSVVDAFPAWHARFKVIFFCGIAFANGCSCSYDIALCWGGCSVCLPVDLQCKKKNSFAACTVLLAARDPFIFRRWVPLGRKTRMGR